MVPLTNSLHSYHCTAPRQLCKLNLHICVFVLSTISSWWNSGQSTGKSLISQQVPDRAFRGLCWLLSCRISSGEGASHLERSILIVIVNWCCVNLLRKAINSYFVPTDDLLFEIDNRYECGLSSFYCSVEATRTRHRSDCRPRVQAWASNYSSRRCCWS